MAKEGAKVVVNSVHSETCDAVKKEIESDGGRAISIPCDVSKQQDVERLIESVKREFGTIDILVNNAGINIVKPAVEMTEEDWDQVLSVNLKSIFLCSKAAASLMIPNNHGRVINIASIVGINPFPNRAPYASSKAAVIMLTRELAIEWARHGIMVNAIAPGFFLTDLMKEKIREGAISEKGILKRVPMGRFGLVEEIGNLAVFLSSDESSYITGQCIAIDGGYTAYGFPD
jgi:NAD(P)-dependent dehydrogenase (short-subunit alcohol dehydrogenase family)